MICKSCSLDAVGNSKYCHEHKAEARRRWLGMINKGKDQRVEKINGHWELYDKAQAAGRLAGRGHTPTPMVVVQRGNPMDDASEVKQAWRVDGGVCGFAWVQVYPGTCSFARWLVKNKLGGSDSYRGGVCIWVSDYGQSYERKIAHAGAMASVLQEGGIKAYSEGRLD